MMLVTNKSLKRISEVQINFDGKYKMFYGNIKIWNKERNSRVGVWPIIMVLDLYNCCSELNNSQRNQISVSINTAHTQNLAAITVSREIRQTRMQFNPFKITYIRLGKQSNLNLGYRSDHSISYQSMHQKLILAQLRHIYYIIVSQFLDYCVICARKLYFRK